MNINLNNTIKAQLLNSLPFALGAELGAEYVDGEWITAIFDKWLEIFRREISNYDGKVATYFSSKRKDLRIPERVVFHLVENKDNDKYHFTLNDKQKILELLICLNRAAEISPLINEFLESGEMMHPLLEEEGILCRIPNWWKRRGSSVRISMQLDKSTDVFFRIKFPAEN